MRTVKLWIDLDIDNDREAWCHNRQACLCITRLNGGTPTVQWVAPEQNWWNDYSKCSGCGEYINLRWGKDQP